MDNNLGNVIKNATARAVIYGAYVIAGLIIGTLQAVIQDPDPQWLEASFRGWAYLAIPVGGLAAVNSNIIPTKVINTESVANVSANTVETSTILDGRGTPQ